MPFVVLDDLVHGLCEFPAELEPFMNHRYVTRLKDISQLGTLRFIHRHAKHSRFEHSIGVAYLAYHAAEAIGATAREQFLVTLAGAFHDIGHGAFSHTFDVLMKQSDSKTSNPYAAHEARSQRLFECVAHDLRDEKLSDLTDGEIDLVKYFINPTTTKSKREKLLMNLPTFMPGLDQIVNNYACQLDVDKLDYILRDSRYLRAVPDDSLESADILAILRRSKVIDGQWTFDAIDAHTIHSIVYTRALLYSNYYLNPKVMAADLQMLKILAAADSLLHMTDLATFETTDDIEKYCELTDAHVIKLLANSTKLNQEFSALTALLKGKTFVFRGTRHADCEMTNMIAVQNKFLIDKSAPPNMLPKISFHKDGVEVQAQKCETYNTFSAV